MAPGIGPGIGPATSLERHNIPIVADLPGSDRTCRLDKTATDTTLAGPSYRINVTTGSSNAIPSKLAQAQSQLSARPPRDALTNPGVDVLARGKIPKSHRANFTVEAQESLASFPTDWSEVEYLPVYGYFGDQGN